MAGDLTLSSEGQNGCAVVTVGGEIDLDTANELNDHVITAMHEIGDVVVINLADVSFMDSTGLKVLLAIHSRAQLAGGRMALAATTRSVQRVLDVTGLDHTFEIFATVAEAVEGLQAHRDGGQVEGAEAVAD